MNAQFSKLLQIGIIVENVDEAVKNYEERFGMGPWRIAMMDTDEFPEMLIDGKPGKLKNKCAFCNIYGMEIELVEPQSESVYKEWLDTHGPGIHHLAFVTRDSFQEVLEQCQEMTGKAPWIHGEERNIGMDFAYVDLRKELGLICELYNEDRSQQPGHPA